MRSIGAVHRKLREVKHRHLVELYKKHLRRSPILCRYNRPFRVESEDGIVREVRLCMLHQPVDGLDPALLDVCEQSGHCEQCNAFVCVWTKESVREMFEKELANPNMKARKYPDLCALEWVLEKSVVGIPPFTWIQTAFYTIKRWLSQNRTLQ